MEICQALPNAQIVQTETHDHNYDYQLQGKRFNNFDRKVWGRIQRNYYKYDLIKKLIYRRYYKRICSPDYCGDKNGLPLDQTIGKALAQIQIVITRTLK